MAALPLPPFLPESLESFEQHVVTHMPEWFEYCRQAFDTVNNMQTRNQQGEEKISDLLLQLQNAKQELNQYKESLQNAQAIQNYQREEIDRLQKKVAIAEVNEARAISVATPAVNTPLSAQPVGTAAKEATAPPAGTITPPDATPSEASCRSERISDPEKFEGSRADLRRFLGQIQAKMKANADRFHTAQARMAYVASQLGPIPYAQVLPYAKDGTFLFTDYEDILRLLERAYGDPNRVRNAQRDLFTYRQTNKEFSVFFAEFQRLAIESELPEAALPTILEQAISKELRNQLMYVSASERDALQDYRNLAQLLQDLENSRLSYGGFSAPVRRTYASTVTPRPAHEKPIQPQSVVPARHQSPAPGEPMDLSSSRRGYRRPSSRGEANRKEQGLCFRCGSAEHLVARCPLPDNRLVRTRPMVRNSSPDSSCHHSPRGYRRSSTTSRTENGVSLD
jgi:hypothetical protein